VTGSLDETDWDALLHSLRNGNCILLLGEEASRAGGRPLKAILADEIAKDMGTAAGGSFAAVAREYQQDRDANALRARVARFYRSRGQERSDIHEDLAALPFPLVLTSCHDRLFEQALEQRGQPFLKDYYSYRAGRRALTEMGGPAKPLVYSLYGSIDDSDSLVLTENDLLDFLVAIISDNPPLPDRIRGQLKDPLKTFLFVGFGIRHWYLRILLHVLRQGAQNRSFALEDFEPPLPPDLDQTLLFYRKGFRIYVIREETAAFVKELRRLHGDRATAAPTRAGAAPVAGAPSVFISYVRVQDDRQAAERLYQAFHEAGLRPWMDRDLETGERWDSTIKQRISEADYFVVLLTPALQAKPFGYVNKEINLALERQQYARRSTKFILPVRFDETPIPAELSEIQANVFDLGSGDLTPLTSLILRDHQLRQRAGS
jgi:hypothetical protein